MPRIDEAEQKIFPMSVIRAGGGCSLCMCISDAAAASRLRLPGFRF